MRSHFRLAAWLIGLCILALSTSATLAQTSTTATLTVITGRDGTNDSPVLTIKTLNGAVLGTTTLDQPGDLRPGGTNSYNLFLSGSFCDATQFELVKPASGRSDDAWGIQRLELFINGISVWFNSAQTRVTASQSTGGSWQATQAYRDQCGELAWTLVELKLVTGSDGTENAPRLELVGSFSGSPYAQTLSQSNDLHAGSTTDYAFIVPMEFCEMTGFNLRKPADNGADDAWDLREIYLSIAGTQVFFDRDAGAFSPVTATSNPPNGNWSGTAAYQDRCSGVSANIGAPLLDKPLDTSNLSNLTLATPVPTLSTKPVLTVGQIPDNTANNPIPPNPNLTTNSGAIPPNPTVGNPVTCPGFMVSRLIVGKQGRVLPGDANNLRSGPSKQNQLLGQIPGGGVFTVVSGPVCDVSGIAYWQVNYNGVIGYTGEGQGSEYWVEPLP